MDMQPIACDRCGTEVLVRKFSYRHTSVQWRGDAGEECAEFRAAADAGERRMIDVHTCQALRSSIERAVLDGRVAVPEEDGDRSVAGLGSPAEAETERTEDRTP